MEKDAKWLAYGAIFWLALVSGMAFGKMAGVSGGVQNSSPVLIGLVIALYILFPLAYARATNGFGDIGLRFANLKIPLSATVLVTLIYSAIRSFMILYVPGSSRYVAATAIQTAGILKQDTSALPIVLVFSFVGPLATELFYRGFIFTALRKHTHWVNALLVSALMFSVAHWFAVGLTGFVMALAVSIVAGWLMQKYNTIAAPVLFHFLQYVVAILLYWLYVP